MTYDEAVAYALREKSAAYAFIPETRSGRVIGGDIYAIAYEEEYEADPEAHFEYNIYCSSGLFRSSSGEGDMYGPDDVPEEARALTYLPTDPSAAFDYDMMLEFFLLRLKGMSEEEANDNFDHMTIDQILQFTPVKD